jgi:ribose transport system substrate-binding protein
MKTRYGKLILIALIVLVLFASCTPQPADTSEPDEAAASSAEEASQNQTEPEEYVVVALNWAHPYWIDIRTGGEYFQEAMGDKVVVTFAGPQDLDFPGQVDTIVQQISKKPAGMLVAAFDPGVVPAINEAIAAGIPVGTFESDVPKDNDRYFFVGVNAFNAGHAMGPELIKAIGESGEIIISTNVGASNSEEKIRGLESFLVDYPDIEIVATVDDKTVVREGADALKPAIQANPDVDAIIGVNSGSGGAAATAVKELGLEDQIHIVCQDRDDITLEFIKEGVIDSTIVTRTATNTYMGLLLLYQYNNYDVPITEDNQANNVVWLPENVDVGTVVVNKDNVDAFFH